MMFWKGKLSEHFDKVLLIVLFAFLIVLCVHLMHKSDAGGEDSGFIVWAQTQAAMVLGALIGLIKGTSMQTTSTEVSPTPPTKLGEPTKVETTSTQS